MIRKEKIFSVIIPLYNKAPHISRAIYSVLNQTFNEYEIIIINDASTDDSVKEVNKFSDSRIRLFHRDTPGPGGYAARNFGIKKATGEWIAFLDADDEWIPDHLQKMYELAQTFPECDFLSCGWETIEADGRVYNNHFFNKFFRKGNHVITFEEYIANCIRSRQPTCMDVTCLRRSKIDENLFPAGRLKRGGDLYAWIVYLAKVKKMAWSSHLGAIYYRDSINMVTKTVPVTSEITKKWSNEFFNSLKKNEKYALMKYCNYLIWNAWFVCRIKQNNYHINPFFDLNWRYGVFQCFIYGVMFLMPKFVLNKIFKGLHLRKKVVINHQL